MTSGGLFGILSRQFQWFQYFAKRVVKMMVEKKASVLYHSDIVYSVISITIFSTLPTLSLNLYVSIYSVVC